MTEATCLPRNRPSAMAANLACMGAMVAWAVGFPMVNKLLPVMEVLPLAAARMGVAALTMLPIWLIMEGGGVIRHAPWQKGLIIGGFGFGLGAYLLIVAQSLTDGVTVAIMSAMMPIVGIAIECVFDGRNLTLSLVFGLCLSLLGGVLAYSSGLRHLHFGLGAAAMLLSVLIYCWASRATIRELADLSPLGRTSITLVGSALSTGLAYATSAVWYGPEIKFDLFGYSELGYLFVYGFASLAISQILWIFGVGRLGIGIAAMHINAAPFYVMLLVVMGGGHWNWLQAASALIVGLGVLVAQGMVFRRP